MNTRHVIRLPAAAREARAARQPASVVVPARVAHAAAAPVSLEERCAALARLLGVQPPLRFPFALSTSKLLAGLSDADRKVARKLVAEIVANPRYVQALATSAIRYSIDGTPAGAVSDKHRAYAQQALAERASKKESAA